MYCGYCPDTVQAPSYTLRSQGWTRNTLEGAPGRIRVKWIVELVLNFPKVLSPHVRGLPFAEHARCWIVVHDSMWNSFSAVVAAIEQSFCCKSIELGYFVLRMLPTHSMLISEPQTYPLVASIWWSFAYYIATDWSDCPFCQPYQACQPFFSADLLRLELPRRVPTHLYMLGSSIASWPQLMPDACEIALRSISAPLFPGVLCEDGLTASGRMNE